MAPFCFVFLIIILFHSLRFLSFLFIFRPIELNAEEQRTVDGTNSLWILQIWLVESFPPLFFLE